MTPAPLWTAQELADFVGVPIQTVYAWSHRGGGPVACRVGRHLRYRATDVERWLDEHAHDRPERVAT